MGCWLVHLLRFPQEGVFRCGAIHTVGRRQWAREVHYDPAINAVLLGLGEKWVSLAPRYGGGGWKGASIAPLLNSLAT